jgi:3-methyl-2-oxobutanoate hydroxymethyltransferase
MSDEQPNPYGGGASVPPGPTTPVKRVRTHHLREMKERGEKITMLTVYDMYTAQVFDEAGIDILFTGDSAANNVLGYATTLPVTVDELIPLARAQARTAKRAQGLPAHPNAR